MAYDHPMARWAEKKNISIADLAKITDCSEAHLRNIFARRKEPSLPLAKMLSDLSKGKVPMHAFLRERA
jgi:hypothetical protein